MRKLNIQPGERYGRLTIVNELLTVNKRRFFKCSCDCGNMIEIHLERLRIGNTKSCGCLRRETTSASFTSHGERKGKGSSPEYRSWAGMMARCFNKKNARYKDYGGRGITVTERWNDFSNFLADMGRKPSSKHSLDRIDNNGNYEPSNCRWATWHEQKLNTRAARFIEYNNKMYHLSELAKLNNMSAAKLHQRLARGWSIEDAIDTP